MKKLPRLTILTLFLTILFIGCTEKKAKYLPDEIVIHENGNHSRTYKLKYNKDNKLVGFDMAYSKPSHPDSTEMEIINDSILFNYGRDGRLIGIAHILGNDADNSIRQNIYYMSKDTIQFDTKDSVKTHLLLNDSTNQLLRIQTSGYEGGYLYGSDERIKSITHNIMSRDTTISDALGIMKVKFDYDNTNTDSELKRVFSDLEFPEWMLLYCGLEVLVYNPNTVSVYRDSLEVADKISTLVYDYNEDGYPVAVNSKSETSDLRFTVNYRKSN